MYSGHNKNLYIVKIYEKITQTQSLQPSLTLKISILSILVMCPFHFMTLQYIIQHPNTCQTNGNLRNASISKWSLPTDCQRDEIFLTFLLKAVPHHISTERHIINHSYTKYWKRHATENYIPSNLASQPSRESWKLLFY